MTLRLTLVLVASCITGESFGQAPRPCLAFILRGDVVVACDKQRTQITHRGDIEAFAISDDRLALAYTASRVLERTATVKTSAQNITIVDLRSHSSNLTQGAGRIVSSCGGILLVNALSGDTMVRDLLAGDNLAFRPYQRFRCSADRKTIVGIANVRDGDLVMGLPPTVKLKQVGDFEPNNFNISPNGSKVVFLNKQLCVSSSGTSLCSNTPQNLSGAPSVNDEGEVLVSVGTNQECFYKTPHNFSPSRFPGATDESRDQCLAIGHWKPGTARIEIIEPLGRDPQWIRSATAELLLAEFGRAAGDKKHVGR